MSKSVCSGKQDLGIIQLLHQLNSNSNINTFKILVQIRTDVIKDKDGISELKEKGGIKILVKLLSKPNVKILNILLSILGNCCLQEECRTEAVSCGVISPLVKLLRTINDDHIQSRICRLVGNLAQSFKIAIRLHDAGIMNDLVCVLKATTSASTQQMAIRSLRLMWNITRSYDNAMLKAGVVSAVATYLGAEDSDVSNAALRAIESFTRNCSCAAALQVKESGFDKLVLKMNESFGSQCLYNLSHVSLARIELIKANVVERIVSNLESHLDSSLMTILCLLCRESVGRARLRHSSNGLALMVKVLRNSSCRNQQTRILNALSHFLFDDSSLQILVQEGLVSVLVKMLTDHISKNGVIHHAEEKSNVSNEELNTSGNVSPCSSGFSPRGALNNHTGYWSPLSEECSPSSVVTMSPPGAYSPLCVSDEELEGSPKQPEDESMDIQQEIEKSEVIQSLSSITAEDFNDEATILELLCHVAYMKNPVGAMVDKTTISTLIDYIRLFKDPNIKARKILCSIAGNKYYYEKLLDDQMVLTVHERLCRPIHSQCVQCERIASQGTEVLEQVSKLAESGLGEGEMKYRLLKADTSIKIMVSLTIPHVIKERVLLMKLLVDYKALSYLLDALNEKLEEAVPGFSALFKTLHILNPQLPMSMCSHCDVGSLRREGTLVFLLDDGSTVSANKTSLCNISPYFEAMFRGGFKESEQTSIRLGDITAACFTSFLRIADTYCECILPKDVNTLLELVVATDRFLVTDLTEKILSIVMNHSLNCKSAHIVYSWGVENSFKFDIASEVPLNVVKYVLSADMTPKQRLEVMTAVLESKYRYDFVNDMVNLIKAELSKRTFNLPPRRTSLWCE